MEFSKKTWAEQRTLSFFAASHQSDVRNAWAFVELFSLGKSAYASGSLSDGVCKDRTSSILRVTRMTKQGFMHQTIPTVLSEGLKIFSRTKFDSTGMPANVLTSEHSLHLL